MVKTKQLAVVLGGVGVGAGVLYWWFTRPPPGKYRLVVKALADGTEVAVDITVDATPLTTPDKLDLDQGTYTITAPDEIIVEGETYYYSGEEYA